MNNSSSTQAVPVCGGWRSAGTCVYVSDCSARGPCRVSHGGRELVSRTFRHRNLGCLRWSHTSSLVPLSLRLDYVLAAELSASPCTSSAGGTEDQCLGGYSRGYPHPVRVSPNLICAPLKTDFEYHLRDSTCATYLLCVYFALAHTSRWLKDSRNT